MTWLSQSRLLSLVASACLLWFIINLINKPFTNIGTELIFLAFGILSLKEAIARRNSEALHLGQGAGTGSLFERVRLHWDLIVAALLLLTIVPISCIKLGWLWLDFAFCLLMVISFFVIAVPALGYSMVPTINDGDLVIAELGPLFRRRPVKRGDIVLFPQPLSIAAPAIIKRSSLNALIFGPTLLKRVVGLPGETVKVMDGKVYINDGLLEESARILAASYELKSLSDIGNESYRPYAQSDQIDAPIIVPEGHYFVLGDFRVAENIDSHIFGFVPVKMVWGRVIAALPLAWPGGIFGKGRQLSKHLKKANRLFQENRFEQAIKECDKALATYEQSVTAFVQRARANLRLARLNEALPDCNQALALYNRQPTVQEVLQGDAATAYSIRSLVYHRQQRYQEALADCDQVIRLLPKGVTGYLNRSLVLHDANRTEESLKDLEKAIQLNCASSLAYKMRGSIKIKSRQWLDALVDFQKAIELGAADATCYSNCAYAHYELGQLDQSFDECEKAIRLDPMLAPAFKNRARVHLYRGCNELAFEDLNKAIQLDANRADFYFYRAQAYTMVGEHDLAQIDKDKACQLGWLDPE